MCTHTHPAVVSILNNNKKSAHVLPFPRKVYHSHKILLLLNLKLHHKLGYLKHTLLNLEETNSWSEKGAFMCFCWVVIPIKLSGTYRWIKMYRIGLQVYSCKYTVCIVRRLPHITAISTLRNYSIYENTIDMSIYDVCPLFTLFHWKQQQITCCCDFSFEKHCAVVNVSIFAQCTPVRNTVLQPCALLNITNETSGLQVKWTLQAHRQKYPRDFNPHYSLKSLQTFQD